MKDILEFVVVIAMFIAVLGVFVMMFTDSESAFGISAMGLGGILFVGAFILNLISDKKA